MVTVIIIAAVAGALAAGARYGADSRPGFDERPECSRFGALT